MLATRTTTDKFVVFDVDIGEPIMRFDSRLAADEFIAELTVAELHAQLLEWVLPEVPIAA